MLGLAEREGFKPSFKLLIMLFLFLAVKNAPRKEPTK